MRFVIDSMLGTLARKLRIFGFDSLYYNHIDDEELLSLCLAMNRILLTSDEELFRKAMKCNVRCIFVNSNDEDNLAKISSILNLRLRFDIKNSRCPLCNCSLTIYAKEMAKDVVPKNVYERNEEFYFCTNCKKVYWKGSHIKKIQELEERVNARLAKY